MANLPNEKISEAAESALEKAKEAGDQEEIEKLSKRTVRVSKVHSEEVMKLARLLGLPVFEAPCEAEATCAALCKAGLVYAAASEDMDTLCFSTPKLARNLMAPSSQEKPILEFDFDKLLAGLELTWDQFIDVCILCGCDYCDSIKGIGPINALKYIKQYGNIEGLLEHLDKEKYPVPDDWPYKEARVLFQNPEVVQTDGLTLKWTAPDEEAVVAFLCGEKSFNEDRIRKQLADLKKARSQGGQNRLETFSAPLPSSRLRLASERNRKKAKANLGQLVERKARGLRRENF